MAGMTMREKNKKMKLVIQIPCFNEEKTLPLTLSQLPKYVPGFDEVEWLVIDDGCTDNTAKVARAAGAHVISHTNNKGLAKAFATGIEACLKLGADVIVNTDADNQYDAKCIPDLVQPVLDGRADIVIGERPIAHIKHFSLPKKILQKLGSLVVRKASGTDVPDAPSGFRAMSKDAALQINVFSDYSYTLETIIQAGQKNMAIQSVPINVNEDMRPSKLVTSIPKYIFCSSITIIRIFVIYRPFYFCTTIGTLFLIPGAGLCLRYIYYFYNNTSGHIQSLILASILLGVAFQMFILAFIADAISANRQMLEDIKYKIRKD